VGREPSTYYRNQRRESISCGVPRLREDDGVNAWNAIPTHQELRRGQERERVTKQAEDCSLSPIYQCERAVLLRARATACVIFLGSKPDHWSTPHSFLKPPSPTSSPSVSFQSESSITLYTPSISTTTRPRSSRGHFRPASRSSR
jgi:hypothetical protein